MYDQLDDTLSKRKNIVIMTMNATLKKFRDIPEQIKIDIKTDAKNMDRLGFYNGQLLAIAMVMYNSNITLNMVKNIPQVLDNYSAYLDNATIGDGNKNDLLRYLIIVTDYYTNVVDKLDTLDIYLEREEVQFDEFD